MKNIFYLNKKECTIVIMYHQKELPNNKPTLASSEKKITSELNTAQRNGK